jgi:hypothetical protein
MAAAAWTRNDGPVLRIGVIDGQAALLGALRVRAHRHEVVAHREAVDVLVIDVEFAREDAWQISEDSAAPAVAVSAYWDPATRAAAAAAGVEATVDKAEPVESLVAVVERVGEDAAALAL